MVVTGLSGLQLDQNYSNPFNPVTTIRYHLAEPAEVDLSVFNIAGARVAVLDEGYRSEGSYMVEFSAQNLASGLYFYRLQVNVQLQRSVEHTSELQSRGLLGCRLLLENTYNKYM